MSNLTPAAALVIAMCSSWRMIEESVVSMSHAFRRVLRWIAGPLVVLLILVMAPGSALATASPIEVHGQTVRSGHLRVQVLTSTLLRLEYAADDRLEDRQRSTRSTAVPVVPRSPPAPPTASCRCAPATSRCTTNSTAGQ
jgi:hypothetical protein